MVRSWRDQAQSVLIPSGLTRVTMLMRCYQRWTGCAIIRVYYLRNWHGRWRRQIAGQIASDEYIEASADPMGCDAAHRVHGSARSTPQLAIFCPRGILPGRKKDLSDVRR